VVGRLREPALIPRSFLGPANNREMTAEGYGGDLAVVRGHDHFVEEARVTA
jgi:hypothetical protein